MYVYCSSMIYICSCSKHWWCVWTRCCIVRRECVSGYYWLKWVTNNNVRGSISFTYKIKDKNSNCEMVSEIRWVVYREGSRRSSTPWGQRSHSPWCGTPSWTLPTHIPPNFAHPLQSSLCRFLMWSRNSFVSWYCFTLRFVLYMVVQIVMLEYPGTHLPVLAWLNYNLNPAFLTNQRGSKFYATWCTLW